MEGIVVGHDGSSHAQVALREALDIAQGLGEVVTVVRAFGLRQTAWPKGLPFGYVPSIDDLGAHVRVTLEEQVAPLREEFPGVEITTLAAEGNPANVLLKAGMHARMLVVAARGLGGLPRLLLGSVSQRVVSLADCPVLVIKDPSGPAHN